MNEEVDENNLSKQLIEQIIKNNGLTLLEIEPVNNYRFYSSKGYGFGNNIFALKIGGKLLYVPIIYSLGKDDYENQIKRLIKKINQ